MIALGIVGGMGSGKSTVTKYLIEKGACHLDGDKIAHEVLAYPEVQQQLQARWKTTDRKEIAKFVFSKDEKSKDELRILEDITWPLINAKLYESFSRYNQTHTKVLILDIPLLIEVGWVNLCNRILFVDTDKEKRKQRYFNRQQWNDAVFRGCYKSVTSININNPPDNQINYVNSVLDDFELREARQLPLEDKKKIANYVVNNETMEDLYKQLDKVWEDLNGK